MLGNCHMHAVLDGVFYKDAIAAHSGPDGPNERIVREMLSAYRDIGVGYLRDGGDRWGACLLAKRLAPEYGIEYAAPSFPIHKNGLYGGFIGRGYDDLGGFKALVDEATIPTSSVRIALFASSPFSRMCWPSPASTQSSCGRAAARPTASSSETSTPLRRK